MRWFMHAWLMSFFWIGVVAHATPGSQQSLVAHFNSFFHSPVLNARFCGQNIDAFIRHLGRHGDLPPDFRRVVIRAPNSAWHPESMLIAVGSRFGRSVSEPAASGISLDFWYHHVIGISGGKVYDFSFSTQPRVLTIRDYMHEMYVPAKPFMLFGPTFRIRGMGPYYRPEDAKAEVEAYTFEIQRVDAQARQTQVRVHPNLRDFLVNEAR